MGQCHKAIRLVVADRDEDLRAELHSLKYLGIEVVFADPADLADAFMPEANCDVVVASVETPAGLALVANTCKRHLATPVIAVGGAGFEKKSLEHVLLLAEVRGAVASMPKPIAAADLAMIATQAVKHAHHIASKHG